MIDNNDWGWPDDPPEGTEKQPEGPVTKRCRWCGKDKPLDDYYINAALRDGHSSECKMCKSAYDTERNSKVGKNNKLLRSWKP